MSDAQLSTENAHRLLKWKRDIILATSPANSGNSEDEAIHYIVLAMLKLHTHSPRLGSSAHVDADGNVSALIFGTSAIINNIVLGKVQHINDALRRLADHCKLSDTDRQAMFKAFADWISHDARANDKNAERVH